MSEKEIIGSKPDGTPIWGTRVGITKEDSSWLVFQLEDKTILRLKVVLTRVGRAEGEYMVPSGDPVYILSPQFIVDVQAPAELRKKME
jgi:hypothetical protein